MAALINAPLVPFKRLMVHLVLLIQSIFAFCLDPNNNNLFPLTVFLSLERDLSALLLALGVGQRQPDVDRAEGRQVPQSEVGGVSLHGQALPDGGVVAPTAPCWHGVAVAEGQGVGVTAGEVVAQGLPLEGQLPRLDLCSGQAPQGPHGFWGDGEQTVGQDRIKRTPKNLLSAYQQVTVSTSNTYIY